MPGWRVGWLIFHDKGTGRLADYKTGVKSLTQITLGASSLLQAALPHVLCAAPGSKDAQTLAQFMEYYMSVLSTNTKVCMEEAKSCAEISVIQPAGAMYMMIRIEMHRLVGITDDAEFSRKLLEEENLFILPGQCFNMPNFVRLVICPPPEIIQEAMSRLKAFCARYRNPALPAAPATVEASHSASTLTDVEEEGEDDEEEEVGATSASAAASKKRSNAQAKAGDKRRRVQG